MTQINSFDTDQLKFLNKFVPEGFVMEIPDYLYHYTDSAGLNGLMNIKSIWLTSFKFMNDSRELIHGMDILGKKLDQFLEPEVYQSGFIKTCKDIWDFILKESKDPALKPYIFCMTKKKDHLSQWRGYGDFGKGFCIEFDCSKVQELFGQGYILGKVHYDESMFEALCADMVQSWLNICLSEAQRNHNVVCSKKMRDLAVLFMQAAFALCIKFKHYGFNEEEEWRLFKFIERNSPTIKSRKHRLGQADYHELTVDPLTMVTEIMTGPKGPESKHLGFSLPPQIAYTKSPIPFI